MKNFCALIGKYFGLLAVAFLVLALWIPAFSAGSSAKWAVSLS